VAATRPGTPTGERAGGVCDDRERSYATPRPGAPRGPPSPHPTGQPRERVVICEDQASTSRDERTREPGRPSLGFERPERPGWQRATASTFWRRICDTGVPGTGPQWVIRAPRSSPSPAQPYDGTRPSVSAPPSSGSYERAAVVLGRRRSAHPQGRPRTAKARKTTTI
jgi:hypothetical protein